MSDKFEWNDALAEKFAKEYRFSSSRISLEMFKADNQPKEKDIPKDYQLMEVGCKCDIGKIFSVKRLSDGEIFSIDDRLADMEIGEEYIDGFKLNYKGNDVWVSVNMKKGYGVSLDSAKMFKPKVPLFFSYKNEPIYDNDTYWFVNNHFIKLKHTAYKDLIPNTNYARFLNENDCDDYVLQTKPIELTFNDLESLFTEEEIYPYGVFRNKLKDFFKSKINP